jgi:hypothetical protein
MKGLCVHCKKVGIDKEIEMTKTDSLGRTMMQRSCGIHN